MRGEKVTGKGEGEEGGGGEDRWGGRLGGEVGIDHLGLPYGDSALKWWSCSIFGHRWTAQLAGYVDSYFANMPTSKVIIGFQTFPLQ